MKFLKVLGIGLIGLLVGFINGLLGGGGGMLCVPFLIYCLKLKDKNAHASAIFIILLTSIVSSVFYIINGFYSFKTGVWVGVGVIVGGVIGAFLLKKLSSNIINIVFYVIMLGAGIKLLV